MAFFRRRNWNSLNTIRDRYLGSKKGRRRHARGKARTRYVPMQRRGLQVRHERKQKRKAIKKAVCKRQTASAEVSHAVNTEVSHADDGEVSSFINLLTNKNLIS